MVKFLVVGLGNIGTEYANTRHNIGFDIADAYAARHLLTFRSDRLADVAQFKLKGKPVTIIKPTTYMNLSGRAVKYWLDKENIDISNMLVLVDELALPLNKLRVRPSGSDAGHNGLKSIQEALQTDKYPRLRFGIGNNYPKGMQVDFVLSKWLATEQQLVNAKISKCVEIIDSFIFTGIERTMNEANKLDFIV
ncbi:MAG TPA: aminoacyl-tRNA hydrolase [Flavitalea sp.]|nr:aminoacyl-tRNA hydrolase [Flavitalea sp.]